MGLSWLDIATLVFSAGYFMSGMIREAPSMDEKKHKTQWHYVGDDNIGIWSNTLFISCSNSHSDFEQQCCRNLECRQTMFTTALMWHQARQHVIDFLCNWKNEYVIFVLSELRPVATKQTKGTHVRRRVWTVATITQESFSKMHGNIKMRIV